MLALYNNLQFRTRLEAQWAAFFDLAGWKWWTNPSPVGSWAPEFRVELPCGHSECGDTHTLLVAVLDVSTVEAFKHHPCRRFQYGGSDGNEKFPADAGAGFGSSPHVSVWDMSNGAGGGTFEVDYWVNDADALSSEASRKVK